MTADNIRSIARVEPSQASGLARWDAEQLEVIKTLICPGASDAELALFGQVCQRTGLDPFAKQIYGIMRTSRKKVGNDWVDVSSLSIQTSIDGLRLIADRSGKYQGQVGPQWCGEDGVWRDVWLSSDYPAAARVGVLKTGFTQPLWAVARWDSYVQTFTNRQTKQAEVSSMWARMPDVMIAKVAEALALRRAFPAELSGLYGSDEMGQADNPPLASIAPPEPESAPCDGQHFNARWHAIVKGTRFADDDTRHKFIAWYTGGRYESLGAFLGEATHDEAVGLIDAISTRIKAEAKKAARQAHQSPPVVEGEVVRDESSAPASDLTDEELDERLASSSRSRPPIIDPLKPTRTALVATLRQAVKRGNDAGGSFEVPANLADLSDEAIQEMIESIERILTAAATALGASA